MSDTEDEEDLFTEREKQQLMLQFRARANASGNLSQDVFIREICKEKRSSFFGKRLFQSFDLDNSGEIDMDEYLQCCHLFLYGTSDERSKWLFELLDVDHSDSITVADFQKLAAEIVKEEIGVIASEKLEALIGGLVNVIQGYKGQDDFEMKYEEFHEGCKVFVEWWKDRRPILEVFFDFSNHEADTGVTPANEEPIALSDEDQQKFKYVFMQFTNGNSYITQNQIVAFSEVALGSTPNTDVLKSQFVKCIDEDGDGKMTFDELSSIFGILTSNNSTEKFTLFFKLIDLNQDGVISPDEFDLIITHMVSDDAKELVEKIGTRWFFDLCDKNKDGDVDCAEFIAELSLWQERIRYVDHVVRLLDREFAREVEEDVEDSDLMKWSLVLLICSTLISDATACVIPVYSTSISSHFGVTSDFVGNLWTSYSIGGLVAFLWLRMWPKLIKEEWRQYPDFAAILSGPILSLIALKLGNTHLFVLAFFFFGIGFYASCPVGRLLLEKFPENIGYILGLKYTIYMSLCTMCSFFIPFYSLSSAIWISLFAAVWQVCVINTLPFVEVETVKRFTMKNMVIGAKHLLPKLQIDVRSMPLLYWVLLLNSFCWVGLGTLVKEFGSPFLTEALGYQESTAAQLIPGVVTATALFANIFGLIRSNVYGVNDDTTIYGVAPLTALLGGSLSLFTVVPFSSGILPPFIFSVIIGVNSSIGYCLVEQVITKIVPNKLLNDAITIWWTVVVFAEVFFSQLGRHILESQDFSELWQRANLLAFPAVFSAMLAFYLYSFEKPEVKKQSGTDLDPAFSALQFCVSRAMFVRA